MELAVNRKQYTVVVLQLQNDVLIVYSTVEAIETTAVAIVAPMKRGRPKKAVQPTTTKNVRTKWSSEDTITLLRRRYQDETIHRKFLNVKNHADRARAWNTLALRFNAAADLNYVYDQVLLPIRVNIYESFLLIFNPSAMSLKYKEKARETASRISRN